MMVIEGLADSMVGVVLALLDCSLDMSCCLTKSDNIGFGAIAGALSFSRVGVSGCNDA